MYSKARYFLCLDGFQNFPIPKTLCFYGSASCIGEGNVLACWSGSAILSRNTFCLRQQGSTDHDWWKSCSASLSLFFYSGLCCDYCIGVDRGWCKPNIIIATLCGACRAVRLMGVRRLAFLLPYVGVGCRFLWIVCASACGWRGVSAATRQTRGTPVSAGCDCNCLQASHAVKALFLVLLSSLFAVASESNVV
ncbi:hypothetical protein BU25DRAFT_144184 [Macroventuria anomochaeta]|uniref:Uncharacterized protein n=1 Tax=Macroventuria anomochaeta TaxID=301207 RepID=A0ACB6SD72_9PLEO|nr:uncharacterized protein BU25DRAFT_144184 [Macroventuria anomochaeta]KAF2632225.1 hypothetical protein BU25DRAFT_144184 [Macroventuria anomochaeta]